MTKHKVVSSSKAKTSVIEMSSDKVREEPSEDMIAEKDEKTRDAYLFRSGRLPPYRQMFYQFKNICLPEAKLLINKYSISYCDEKNGWFKSGLDAKLRDLITETIKSTCYFDDSASMISTSTMQPSIVDEDYDQDIDDNEEELDSDED